MTAEPPPRLHRIGLFGGTFDPPHFGHLVVAREAAEELEVDRMLLVVSARPPHKAPPATPPELRLEMVRAAVAGDPVLEASDLEVGRAGASYTVDTLRDLKQDDAETELFLVLGVDQWRELGSWREPAEVARLAQLHVLAREGEDPAAVDPGVGVPCRPVPVTRIDLSSTEVRARIRAGRSVRYLVPPAVAQIIHAHGLYGAVESRHPRRAPTPSNARPS